MHKNRSEIGIQRAKLIRERYLREEITATDLAASLNLPRYIVVAVLKNYSYIDRAVGDLFKKYDEKRRANPTLRDGLNWTQSGLSRTQLRKAISELAVQEHITVSEMYAILQDTSSD